MSRDDKFHIRKQDKKVFRASKKWARRQRKAQDKASGKGCALVILGTAGAIAAGIAAWKGIA